MTNNLYPRWLCFVPGLAPAWLAGHPFALLELLAFTLTLNSLLIATWVWPQWGPTWLIWSGWLFCALFWVVSAIHAMWRLPKWLGTNPKVPTRDFFVEAQLEYLRGNWFDAEALVSKRLTECPDDIEAALLLAGILRRTKRWNQCATCLLQIRLRESAGPWLLEIEREQQLLQRELDEESSEEADEFATA
jgi:hypothetical protein